MSGVWGEKREYNGEPVRTETQDWERERIADLNRRVEAQEQKHQDELSTMVQDSLGLPFKP